MAPPLDPIASLRAALRGHYELEREIGQGAYATVYLARDLKHERKVAVKVLHADPTSEMGELRFIREIRLLARLQHPNILPLHDSGHVEAMLYYVMPYVSGETLRDRIDREKQLPCEAACNIARDVADALAYAHAQGIIHRDIKPENILLSAGHPILADFGIARAIDLAGVRQVTRTGMGSPGTPAYMSPEQLMGDKELDGRSDTYSLGCVLFEMLTGKPPFGGKEGFVKRFTEAPPSVSTTRKDLPGWIDGVVATALARRPNDRYQTAQEFVEALTVGSKGVEPSRLREAAFKRGDENEIRLAVPAQAHAPPSDSLIPDSPRETWVGRLSQHKKYVAIIMSVLLLTATAIAGNKIPSLRNAFFASAVDSTRVALVPFAGSAQRQDRDRISNGLYSTLSEWRGLPLVSDQDVADAAGEAGPPTSTRAAAALAKRVGAGRFIWGQVNSDDPSQARVQLYDVSSAAALASIRFQETRDRAGFARAVQDLLKIPDRPATADGGDNGTKSYVAWRAYGAGHAALAAWDLPSAEQEFKKSVGADPNYAAARVWRAQVAAWRSRDGGADWKAEARRALIGRAALAVRDSLIGEGLAASADEQFPRACASYRQLTLIDPSDFAGWYGLGECQSLDNGVIPDRRSPSARRFRSSYHAAVIAYQRAFRIAPETHSWVPPFRLERLLPATPALPRWGRDSTGAYFMAYPSLSADTIAFVPYPEATFATLPPNAMGRLGAALDRNAQVRRDIALEWVRVSPQSADAHEALADVLEIRGDLTARGKGALSATSALGRAQALASSEEQKLRLLAREVRLHFKLGNFSYARSRADTLLTLYDGVSTADAKELAPVAAMVGKIEKMAQFVRVGGFQDAGVTIPAPLREIGATFFARAALGVCDDGLRDSERLLEQRLDSYVPEENRSEVRAALKWRALSLSAPCNGGISALAIASPDDRLYRMQQSFARGEFNSVRQGFDEVAKARRGMRAGDISLDYIYQEAWLRAAIGDTLQAIKTLALALNALPALSATALKDPAASAAAGRAMMLAADLAAATGDRRSANKWSGGVVDLWKNADPGLQLSVTRMKILRSSSGAR